MKKIVCVMMLAACGGDDDGGAVVDAAAIDAPIDAPPDCGISTTDFGDLGERVASSAVMMGGNGNGLAEIIIPITDGTVPDRLILDLWGGTQQDPDPITGGVYQLTGRQTAMQTCTVCVSIGAQWPDDGAPNFDYVYMATGGTIDLTVDPNPGGAVEFELTDVTFTHVSLGPNGGPLNDGCVTAVDRLVFRGSFESDSSVAPDDQAQISGPRYLRQ